MTAFEETTDRGAAISPVNMPPSPVPRLSRMRRSYMDECLPRCRPSLQPVPQDVEYQFLVIGEAMVAVADEEHVDRSTARRGELDTVVPADDVVPHAVDDQRRRRVPIQQQHRIVL